MPGQARENGVCVCERPRRVLPLLSLLEGFALTLRFQGQGWKCSVKTQLRNYSKLEKVWGDGGGGVTLPASALGPFPHGSDPKGASPPGKAPLGFIWDSLGAQIRPFFRTRLEGGRQRGLPWQHPALETPAFG